MRYRIFYCLPIVEGVRIVVISFRNIAKKCYERNFPKRKFKDSKLRQKFSTKFYEKNFILLKNV